MTRAKRAKTLRSSDIFYHAAGENQTFMSFSHRKRKRFVWFVLLSWLSSQARQLARQETEEVFQALAAVASYEKKRRLRRRSNVKSQTGIS